MEENQSNIIIPKLLSGSTAKNWKTTCLVCSHRDSNTPCLHIKSSPRRVTQGRTANKLPVELDRKSPVRRNIIKDKEEEEEEEGDYINALNRTLKRQKEEIERLKEENNKLRENSINQRRPLKQSMPVMKIRRKSSECLLGKKEEKEEINTTRHRSVNVESVIVTKERPVIKRDSKEILVRRGSDYVIKRRVYQSKEEKKSTKEKEEYERMKKIYDEQYKKRLTINKSLLEKKASRLELKVKSTEVVTNKNEGGDEEENSDEKEYKEMMAEYHRLNNNKIEPEKVVTQNITVIENFTPYKNGVLNYRVDGPINTKYCFICRSIDTTVIGVKILTDRSNIPEMGNNIPVYREINICNTCQSKRDLSSPRMYLPDYVLGFFKPLEVDSREFIDTF